MGFAWSHTTYALWHGMVFNFEDKWDLDYFLAHAEGSKRISSNFAYMYVYDYKHQLDFIRVFSSRSLGADKDRQRRIKEWKKNGKIKC